MLFFRTLQDCFGPQETHCTLTLMGEAPEYSFQLPLSALRSHGLTCPICKYAWDLLERSINPWTSTTDCRLRATSQLSTSATSTCYKVRQGVLLEVAARTCEPQDGTCRVFGPCRRQAAAAVLLRGAPRLAAAVTIHAVGPARVCRPPAACMHATHEHVNTPLFLESSPALLASRLCVKVQTFLQQVR